ncbi:MAG: peptidoglycan binding domain-containing protein [bacterium]|nr:peptidoglycan binding domain-containing protein [bacterium]
MDAQQSRRRASAAHERNNARQRRRQAMATRINESRSALSRLPLADHPRLQQLSRQGGLLLQDARWHIGNNPLVLRGAVVLAVVLVVLYFISYLLSGRILPGISVLDLGLSGLSQADAAAKLDAAWRDELQIALVVDGETVESVRPSALGLELDATETAKQARSAGLTGMPFGRELMPTVSFDYLIAQTYLLNLTEQLNRLPYNAGYRLENGQVVGVPGQDGRSLDVTMTLERLNLDTAQVARRGRLDLVMTTLQPDVTDPAMFLDEVEALAAQPLELKGYDPFYNQHFTWPIEPVVFVEWLEAGISSLTLREETFLPYVDALNATLNPNDENLRFLSPDETLEMLNEAISNRESSVNLRVRYRPTTYEVQPGDSGYGIARKTGIPYYLIEQLNNGRDMDQLSVGDLIQIPSRDVTMQHPPLPNKRIVVNLDTQSLVAYENGQQVFAWAISSGVSNAPTSPGIYQVLNHEPVAYGSSNTLCDTAGLVCGQWEMNWFMGIYEAVPGLLNGFHGAVLLPNGTLLGGGSVGFQATFGCVMSRDDEARMLYEWAEVGTVVEIISGEYPPVSDLARLATSGA